MNKAEKHPSLLHSRALYGAATCLLLTTGIAMPAFASQESSSVPSINATQQNTVTVRGSVKDANGEPIIGVSIVEKGNMGNGSVTDLNGNYILHVRRGARLIVSYIGFQSQEVPPAKARSRCKKTTSRSTRWWSLVMALRRRATSLLLLPASRARTSHRATSRMPVT